MQAINVDELIRHNDCLQVAMQEGDINKLTEDEICVLVSTFDPQLIDMIFMKIAQKGLVSVDHLPIAAHSA